MSYLATNNLTAPGGMGGSIQVTPDTQLKGVSAGSLYAPGMPLQTVINTQHNRSTWSSPQSGNGTTITDMNVTITPKFANSLIYLEWRLHYELQHDNVFLIHKNGSLIGYNTDSGNNMWSGIATANYDGDDSSTPAIMHLVWWDYPGSTSAVTYAPAIRCSSNTSYTMSLNRTLGSTGQWGHENGVSVGMAMEIAQ
jgi:hypothetical protein